MAESSKSEEGERGGRVEGRMQFPTGRKGCWDLHVL